MTNNIFQRETCEHVKIFILLKFTGIYNQLSDNLENSAVVTLWQWQCILQLWQYDSDNVFCSDDIMIVTMYSTLMTMWQLQCILQWWQYDSYNVFCSYDTMTVTMYSAVVTLWQWQQFPAPVLPWLLTTLYLNDP